MFKLRQTASLTLFNPECNSTIIIIINRFVVVTSDALGPGNTPHQSSTITSRQHATPVQYHNITLARHAKYRLKLTALSCWQFGRERRRDAGITKSHNLCFLLIFNPLQHLRHLPLKHSIVSTVEGYYKPNTKQLSIKCFHRNRNLLDGI